MTELLPPRDVRPALAVPLDITDLHKVVTTGWTLVQQHVKECREAYALAGKSERAKAEASYGRNEAWRYFSDPDFGRFSNALAALPTPAVLEKAIGDALRR